MEGEVERVEGGGVRRGVCDYMFYKMLGGIYRV